ncbi:MAG: hypothetical protein IT204_00500, partial [Fimbriimonadaceae bacterium]|nr:hypothetical protein [Fimbriimonadaceae bacterium]
MPYGRLGQGLPERLEVHAVLFQGKLGRLDELDNARFGVPGQIGTLWEELVPATAVIRRYQAWALLDRRRPIRWLVTADRLWFPTLPWQPVPGNAQALPLDILHAVPLERLAGRTFDEVDEVAVASTGPGCWSRTGPPLVAGSFLSSYWPESERQPDKTITSFDLFAPERWRVRVLARYVGLVRAFDAPEWPFERRAALLPETPWRVPVNAPELGLVGTFARLEQSPASQFDGNLDWTRTDEFRYPGDEPFRLFAVRGQYWLLDDSGRLVRTPEAGPAGRT